MPTALQDQTTLKLKKALLERDTNVADLARKMGLSRNYVSQLINHPSHYQHRTAFRFVCKALGVTAQI